jgi:uncharacterized protein (DUF885 family)
MKITLYTIVSVFISVFAIFANDQKNAQLDALFQEEWNFRLAEDPLFATTVGEHRYDDRLPSVTQEDEARRSDFRNGLLQKLKQIHREGLNEADRISYDLFQVGLQDQQDEYRFKGYLIPITVDSGFHTEFARLPYLVTFRTVKDFENYIARLRAFPKYVDQHIELMRNAIRTGMTLPQVVLEGYDVTIATHVVDDLSKSIFFTPFQNFPNSVPQDQRNRLTEEGKEAVREGAIAGYRKFLDFMVNEYRPKARRTLGASEFPNGRDYYAYLIRHFTTLDLTADAIHQIGLREVDRIQKEMQKVIADVGFKGDFASFLKFLRTDPRFYVKSPDQLLKEASYIAKRMDGKLPSLFVKLPRLPYGVAPVPEHLAPKYTAGRYVGPAIGSTEPGYYWVNTYALESRPLYALEALTLHESVPGHHLQTALALELEGLPQFRRFLYVNAFGEGWGLYSEWLGIEAGFYKDPYSNFGRLTYEMWRACRLVVDTGIHSMGWTRQQAMDYMASHTALSLHEVRTETDRYISWPGQALAYKMGELKIKELRHKAESELGEKFDVREFHDAVLGNGSVTLPVLEQIVQSYIQSKSSKTSNQ